jgi:hypothetical protein
MRLAGARAGDTRDEGASMTEAQWTEYVGATVKALRAIADKQKVSWAYLTDDVDDGCICMECSATAFSQSGWFANDPTNIQFDSQEYCEECGKILDHFFTDFGAEAEFLHFYEEGFDEPINAGDIFTADNALTLCNLIDVGNPMTTCRLGEFVHLEKFRPFIHKIGKLLGVKEPT